MTLAAFGLAVLRLAAIVLAAPTAAHGLRARLIGAADTGSLPPGGATAEMLAEAVTLLLHPAAGYFVFELDGRAAPTPPCA